MGLFSVVVGLIGWLITFIYGDALRISVVNAVNARLKARVDVREMEFTVFSSFPNASVRFKDVMVSNPTGFEDDPSLLNAGFIGFQFRLWDLFTGNVKLRGVELEDASVNIFTDRKGRNNYDIFKEDTTSGEGGMKVDLKTILITNTKFEYLNRKSNQTYRFHIDEGELGGDISTDKYSASLEATMRSASVLISGVRYVDGKPCEILASIEVDNKSGTYQIGESKVKLSGMQFLIGGDINTKGKQTEMNLDFSSKDADIASLISLLPKSVIGKFAEFNCSGDITFKGNIKGRVGDGYTPVFKLDFTARNAKANPEGTNYNISELNGSGTFISRKSNAAPYESLVLKSIAANLEGAPFQLNMNLEDFSNPKLDLTLKLDADLDVLSRFYKPDTIEALQGSISADISFNGIAKEKSTYRSSGSIRFANAGFVWKGSQTGMSGLNGILHLRGNDMVLESLAGRIGNTDFTVTGSFNNLMSYFLLDDQRIEVEAAFKSDKVDLDEILAGGSSKSDTFSLDLTDKHRFVLDVSIGSLTFRKFNSTSIDGTIVVSESKVSSPGLEFSTCGGEIRLSGSIDESSVDSVRTSCVAQIRNVDISRLFQQMGNFGQTTLVDRNLKGRLSAKVDFSSRWDKQLNLDEKSVFAKGDITIENGELIQFKPMLALSKYLKGSDLETIRFSNLTNTIEIRDRKIIIPVMDIRSSAMDLTASGTHTFDNMVDYHLGLYLSQIIGRKVRQMNTEFGTIEDDGLGRPRIFLSMKGSATDPKFTWDRKGTEQRITEEIRKERNTIRDLLKKEFGGNRDEEEKPSGQVKKEEIKVKELELETDE
ncbi:MAG: AsmA-like C-terminal region-containing protein [Bacteroidota bacterium]|jgi:hypothetical protein